MSTQPPRKELLAYSSGVVEQARQEKKPLSKPTADDAAEPRSRLFMMAVGEEAPPLPDSPDDLARMLRDILAKIRRSR